MFICTGNICRSPLAHAVFEYHVHEHGMESSIMVDSSGTGAWHVGEQADSRMRRTAEEHGVRLNHHSQKLVYRNLTDFDFLLTMDSYNYRDTLALCRSDAERDKVRMFRDYDPEGKGDVPDPWYGEQDGFEAVWNIVHRTSLALLEKLR